MLVFERETTVGRIIKPSTIDTARSPLPLPFSEKIPSFGRRTFMPKNPKITDGIPANKLIIAVKNFLTRLGQNFEMNTAVNTPSTPPMVTEPSVATIVPTIILNTPYSPSSGSLYSSSLLGYQSFPKTNLKNPIFLNAGKL